MADLLVIKPPGYEQPKPIGNTLLLAGPVGTAKAIIFKVAKFDPTLHPKGAKGLFIDTPDKIQAKDAKVGDVVVAKSGKVFQIEKPTPKGVKVRPVDLHTGEVKDGYTVLAHNVDLALV